MESFTSMIGNENSQVPDFSREDDKSRHPSDLEHYDTDI